MNDPDTPATTGATAAGAEGPRPSRTPWWRSVALLAPAVALVVGLLIGALVVGAGERSGSSRPAPTVTVTADPDASTDDTSVVVPRECLEAAETVEEATDVLQEGVGAVRDFRRDTLVELLNRLEELEAEARGQAATCREVEVESPTESPE